MAEAGKKWHAAAAAAVVGRLVSSTFLAVVDGGLGCSINRRQLKPACVLAEG